MGLSGTLKAALQGANGHLTIYSYSNKGFQWGDGNPLKKTIFDTIPAKAIAPFTHNQALVMGPSKPMGTLVKGIIPEQEANVSPLDHYLKKELFDSHDEEEGSSNIDTQDILKALTPHMEEVEDIHGNKRKQKVSGIILGSQLAKNMNVALGDFVTLISPEERITPMGNMPRAKKFKVVGFFESGMAGYDEVLSFIHLGVSQKIYRLKDRITGLTIKTDNGSDADLYQKQLSQKVKFPYVVSSWIDQNKNLFAVIKLEKLGLSVILTCIILIAAFNIISSLVILVIEKTKDIAILKAMGATDESIRKIFIIQGTIIGITGTAIGVFLGLILCFVIGQYDLIDIPPGVYVGNRIPMYVEAWQIFIISIISVLICFSVTIFPSHKASRLEPIEGLRND